MTTTTRKPKTTRKSSPSLIPATPMSLDQFRSYLKGIMFVGGPNWHPTAEQWSEIVSMIDSIAAATQTQPGAIPAIPAAPSFQDWGVGAQLGSQPTAQIAGSAMEGGVAMAPNAFDESGTYISPFV